VLSLFNSSFSFSIANSIPFSFTIFCASSIVFPNKSGASISSTVSISSVFSWLISKYGKISLKICPPTGAATPPPWVIITTHFGT
jgi:hypothetical protein